ncbi:DUF2073 domain-containing protein [Candidatus Micrarchaeota archaeon]|nr:DUF2073 domain-containing protein [Candidatus Micrarchaeota archaeon]
MAGLQLEFVSSKTLRSKDVEDKVKYILNAVKKEKKILILEEALTREEERILYQRTMEGITKDFPGIEISSFGEEPSSVRKSLIKLLGGKANGQQLLGHRTLCMKSRRIPTSLGYLRGAKTKSNF